MPMISVPRPRPTDRRPAPTTEQSELDKYLTAVPGQKMTIDELLSLIAAARLTR